MRYKKDIAELQTINQGDLNVIIETGSGKLLRDAPNLDGEESPFEQPGVFQRNVNSIILYVPMNLEGNVFATIEVNPNSIISLAEKIKAVNQETFLAETADY